MAVGAFELYCTLERVLVNDRGNKYLANPDPPTQPRRPSYRHGLRYSCHTPKMKTERGVRLDKYAALCRNGYTVLTFHEAIIEEVCTSTVLRL